MGSTPQDGKAYPAEEWCKSAHDSVEETSPKEAVYLSSLLKRQIR